MGLRDLLKKKDEVARRGSEGNPSVGQYKESDFTFIRSDTHSQDFIQPPGGPPSDSNYLSAGPEPSKARRSLDVFRSGNRSRSHSDASQTGASSRRLSERLHLSRAPDSSEKVPQNLPDIVLPNDAQDKDAAESQWEKRATMLATQNERATSRPASPLSPMSPMSPLSGDPRGRTGSVGGIAGRSRSPSASHVVSSKAIDADIQEAIRLHEEGNLPESTRLFGQLANPDGANNPLSQVLYGLALRHGWGCEPDLTGAIKYLSAAASNAASVEQLALQAGLKKGGAAKGELVLAIFELANCFRHGWGIPKDPYAAKQYYETAANLGDTDAMNETAWCYLEGFGCKKDKTGETLITNQYAVSVASVVVGNGSDYPVRYKDEHTWYMVSGSSLLSAVDPSQHVTRWNESPTPKYKKNNWDILQKEGVPIDVGVHVDVRLLYFPRHTNTMEKTTERLTLERLPLEILDGVLAQLTDVSDVLSLCLVSKKAHAVAAPRVFDFAPLRFVLPSRLDDMPGAPGPAPHVPGRLRRARLIEVRPDRWDRGPNRCFHCQVGERRAATPRESVDGEEPLIEDSEEGPVDTIGLKIAQQVLPHLEKVAHGNLEHFSWELGTCIPDEIIGPRGWLTLHHKDIQSLSLVTAGPCRCNHYGLGPRQNMSLSKFRSLKSLTWIGLMEPAELNEATLTIDLNDATLENLELDFISNHATRRLAQEAVVDVLSVQHLTLESSVKFTTLRRLSLSNFCLRLANDLVAAIDWEQLDYLGVRHCTNLSDFLRALVEADVTLGLKTLDVRMHPDERATSWLEKLLRSFGGLENVYMHAECEYDRTGDFLWRALADAHGDTLRLLAYQMRRWHERPYDWFEPMGSLGIADLSSLAAVRRRNPLSELGKLECLGLAARPDILEIILPSLRNTPNLKILHVRAPIAEDPVQSGAEEVFRIVRAGTASALDTATFCAARSGSFFKFVSWVFGDEGLPSVELLAYGDFSTRGVGDDAGFFLRRRARLPEEPRRPAWDFYPRLACGGERVRPLDNLINKYSEFLSAAPTVQLMATA
ncbi:hypothetical protein HJFPF1_00896 [Paramyrothecium foliicola]|nr:hypothetical protein HJFPF1_00896 [Paramyrothecium foliicola]